MPLRRKVFYYMLIAVKHVRTAENYSRFFCFKKKRSKRMGRYYVNGYVTPEGINSKAEVKRMQAALGVKQDGIWGPQTQAAWNAQSQGGSSMPKSASAAEPAIPRPDYAVSGFTPPAGVTDRQKVSAIQANLGVRQDGVWGAQTQAAWEKQYGSLWAGACPCRASARDCPQGIRPA
ncbi:MAG: hypothetical protein EOM66_09900 [Clostridia bacterium]|nr:hypothetical protein [Clostridia bacterium]